MQSSISVVSSVLPRWGIPSVGRVPLGMGVVATHFAVATRVVRPPVCLAAKFMIDCHTRVTIVHNEEGAKL